MATYTEHVAKCLKNPQARKNKSLVQPLVIIGWDGMTPIYLTKACQAWRERCRIARERFEALKPLDESNPNFLAYRQDYYDALVSSE
jgi:hypothetical protein